MQGRLAATYSPNRQNQSHSAASKPQHSKEESRPDTHRPRAPSGLERTKTLQDEPKQTLAAQACRGALGVPSSKQRHKK